MMTKKEYTLKSVNSDVSPIVQPKSNVMTVEKKSPWGKILKLFMEFVVAAVTAFVTTISGSACNLW